MEAGGWRLGGGGWGYGSVGGAGEVLNIESDRIAHLILIGLGTSNVTSAHTWAKEFE